MGKISQKRIIVVITLLCLAGVLIFIRPEHKSMGKPLPLVDFLRDHPVPGWILSGRSSFDQLVVDALLLDDYVNLSYVRGADTISLYVGYYYSAGKIGAAHDPLVCFPGQGWVISDTRKGEIDLDSGQSLDFNLMTGTLGSSQELILYWFQAYDQPVRSTVRQKITLFLKKLTGSEEDNAFVRITMAMEDASDVRCETVASSFAKSFYPVFLSYIRNE